MKNNTNYKYMQCVYVFIYVYLYIQRYIRLGNKFYA